MKTILRALAPLAILASLSGCSDMKAVNAPAPKPGNADYSTYVALGTSISAGWESGGLVDRHQRQAFPVLFAAAAGSAKFDVPTVNGDGLPALMRLVSIGPPLIITNAGRVNGVGTNLPLPSPYHNMAVPYGLLVDVTDTTRYQLQPPFVPPYRPAMFTLIQRGRGSLLAQIATQMSPKPTFISFEFGSNEVLGPTSRGSGTVSPDAAQFAALLKGTLDAIQASLPGVKMALFTVPDVTTIPLVTTLPAVALGANGRPISPLTPLIGPGSVPLVPGQDFVLLTAGPLLAAGMGYPVGTTSYLSGGPVPGNGFALPDSVVFSAAEAASVGAAVNGYNAAIVSEAAARGFAVVDLHGLLLTARASGFTVQGTQYTSAFLSGGLFSLDGVHPSDLAHGILANALIDAVNATYGSQIQHVNLSNSLTARADRAGRLPGEGVAVPATFEGASGVGALFPWRADAP